MTSLTDSLRITGIKKSFTEDMIINIFWKHGLGNIYRVDFDSANGINYACVYKEPHMPWGDELVKSISETGIFTLNCNSTDDFIMTVNQNPIPKANTSKNIHQLCYEIYKKPCKELDITPDTINTTTDTTNILSCESWKNSKAFNAITDKETQIKYYKRNNAAASVLALVELDSKPFGSEAEKILSEIFGLGKRTSTQNDGTFEGKKIEIKTARYWAGCDNCKWQHLEPEHDYDYAMLVLLDFHGFRVWTIQKSLLMGELRDKKVVTFQGKQGWWATKSDLMPHLTPIHTVADLQAFSE